MIFKIAENVLNGFSDYVDYTVHHSIINHGNTSVCFTETLNNN